MVILSILYTCTVNLGNMVLTYFLKISPQIYIYIGDIIYDDFIAVEDQPSIFPPGRIYWLTDISTLSQC